MSGPRRPTRVLLYTAGHTEVGGSAHHSSLIADGLACRGWRLVVVGRATTLTRPRIRRAEGVTVIDVPGFNSPLGAVLYAFVGIVIGALLGRRSHFVAFQLGAQLLPAGLCARAWARPFVAMSTSNGTDGEVALLAGPRRGIHRRLVRSATAVVSQTPAGAAELRRFAHPDRVHVVPNPVRLPAVTADLDGRPRAVFTGRLARQKDLGVLLDAWEEVATDRPGAQLTLVGDGGRFGSTEAELRSRVAGTPLLSQTVRFTGWVPEVEPYLVDADVFVLPSRWEGLSNALLEACAHGRVVVASDIAANSAALGDDHPLMFPTGDAGALADRLRRAFDDPTVRAAARTSALRRVREFEAEAVLDRYSDLLRSSRGSRRRP